MDSICDNRAEIDKLLQTEQNIYKIFFILAYKYQIRLSTPEYPLDIEDRVYVRRNTARDSGFKIMGVDEIYEEIIGLEKTKISSRKSKKRNK